MKFTFPAGGLSCPPLYFRKDTYKAWLMKLTSLLCAVLVVGLQLATANNLKGQNLEDVKVTIELKNESLKAAFHKIEQQTVFRFAYNQKEV